MSIINFGGFEGLTALTDIPGSFLNAGNGVPVLTSTSRTGSLAIRSQGGRADGNYVIGFSTTYNRLILGCAFRMDDNYTTSIIALNLNNSTQVGVAYSAPTGELYIYRGVTTLAVTSTHPLSTQGVWNYIELDVTISTTVGAATAWINGAQVLNVTGVNTANAGGTTANQIQFFGGGPNVSTNSYIDDWYVVDPTDATGQVTRIGDVAVRPITVSSAGTFTQFTPSTGSNFQNVDDATPNNDTDYNEDNQVGHIDTFTMTDITTVASTIYAVKTIGVVKKVDPGVRTVKLVTRSGGTNYFSATKTPSNGYTRIESFSETDPNGTVPWTPSSVNAMELGYELDT